MAKTKLAIAAAALILTAGLGGCLSSTAAKGPATRSSDDDDDRSAHETSREELSEKQITFEPEAGEWAVARFTVDQLLGDEEEANLTIAAEPGDGARPYVGVVLRASSGDQSLPFSVWGALPQEPSSKTLAIDADRRRSNVSVEIAVLVGSNVASTTYRIGLTEGARAQEPLREHRSIRVPLLAERPELDVDPDASGQGGAAGTATVRSTFHGLEIVEHGNLRVAADDETAPIADAHRSVEIGGSGEIPDEGIGGLLLGASGDAGAGGWRLDAALPPAAWGEEAIDVDPEGATGVVPHEIREIVGVESAIAYGSLQVEPGQASLVFERSYTGVGRETVATWGWATFDPGEVYGWEWTEITV